MHSGNGFSFFLSWPKNDNLLFSNQLEIVFIIATTGRNISIENSSHKDKFFLIEKYFRLFLL